MIWGSPFAVAESARGDFSLQGIYSAMCRRGSDVRAAPRDGVSDSEYATISLPALPEDGMRYLDNGHLRLGVDLNLGGAITYLRKVGGPNTVEDADLSRQIQMSYSSGLVPFAPNGKQLERMLEGSETIDSLLETQASKVRSLRSLPSNEPNWSPNRHMV